MYFEKQLYVIKKLIEERRSGNVNTKQQIGKIGEDLATKQLSSSGYRILERNYRGKQGEIDIIATEKNKIIFVEVKARTNLKYGRPAEAVTKTKQIHIEQTAQYYVCKNKLENKQIRFDVVEVYLIAEKYKIKHIKNAIWSV